MPRKLLQRTNEFPYHITARANNREAFYCGPRFAWKTIAGELFLQQVLFGLNIHAFVCMPNHFHLLASFPKRKVDECMRDVMASSTRIINERCQRSGHVFGGPYNWSVVGDSLYYAHVLKYVLRNPVKAGLGEFVADYPFSTYAGAVGTSHLPVVISNPGQNLNRLVPGDPEQLDRWLNSPHQREVDEAINKGLRWKAFEIFPDARTRRPLDLSL